ncbi:MAG: hypothetical protein HSCHL_1454 [Hydrogenibacillus schlegelii]|uniref:EAL domain-containing protein n=1 Tax=Hydrogenibacillus schlegelii TaxID=1484 RepID=A0A2T5G4Q1_HYDSH|nr:hypothetical protein [Hydrogenibacillus schlegelii]PTQ51162.1 MAG: hypothetical protein HSCHL_1454 [Hydrogenibacillus schlegelii]
MQIAIQPIVRLDTGQTIAFELLCRPPEGTAGFFRAPSPEELWLRERLCLEAALRAAESLRQPVHINLTAASLPYLIESRIAWRGAVEIVEWGFPLPERIVELIAAVRARGMRVWIDDLSPLHWPLWRAISGIDGYKIDVRDLVFAGAIVRSGRGVIVERIETADDADRVVRAGVRLGQGYALGFPQPLEMEAKR